MYSSRSMDGNTAAGPSGIPVVPGTRVGSRAGPDALDLYWFGNPLARMSNHLLLA